MSRLMALPVIACDGCGDAMAWRIPNVCPPCVRRAELRRRFVENKRDRHNQIKREDRP